MKDLYNDIKISRVISPVSPTGTGTLTGQVIDTANFANTTFVIEAGAQTTTGITVTPVVLSGTVTGTLASCAAGELIGTEAAAALSGTAGANGVKKIGYIGTDRYARCDLIVTAAASGVYAVQAVQAGARDKPQS